jgi:hypothetical protein
MVSIFKQQSVLTDFRLSEKEGFVAILEVLKAL